MDSWMYQPGTARVGTSASNSAEPESAPSSQSNGTTGVPLNLSSIRENLSPDSKTSAHQQRIRRRNRLITSCLECRRRKLKCDKQAPCTNCTRFGRDCLYLASATDGTSQQKLTDIKEKMGALERNLEREVAGRAAAAPRTSRGATAPGHFDVAADEGDEVGADDEEHLEPTPWIALDNVYGDDGDDDLVDLGVQMGKMRLSERIGGWIRPKLVKELTDTLEDVKSGRSGLESRPSEAEEDAAQSKVPAGRTKIQALPKSYIGPGPDYIAPSSSFFFPGTNMNTSLIDYLPSKKTADRLIKQFFCAVHYMCRVVHRPTFEARYEAFWAQVTTGLEPLPSCQAVIFAALFSATVSMTDDQIGKQFGTSKPTLLDSLRCGTEFALSNANFLRTTKLETMQAFIMYLIPQVRGEVSRAHSALVGTAVRLAECMGLHRDGSKYGMTALEIHVRRLAWHQLLFLDMRTCEATGPKPQIRLDDYDTRFPLNVDDADFLSPNPPTEDRPYWTDATFARIRAETIDLRRQIWFDIAQVDKKKKSLTSTLVKIQKIRSALSERLVSTIDDSSPFQALGRHVYEIYTQSAFVQALHRYLISVSVQMPDRLREVVIEAALSVMEAAIHLETTPNMAPWLWYKGAFYQYHPALLLMVEVYNYPMRKEAPRIWRCLDYVFEIPPHLSPKQKGELVITDLRDRMEIYHQMRKLRSTTQLEQAMIDMGQVQKSVDTANNVGADQIGATSAFQTTGSNVEPANFSPPPPSASDSYNTGSHQSSTQSPGDIQMMEEIDWAEWDKYFPIETNTGDLDVPNFDFAGFNSDLGSNPMDPLILDAATPGTTAIGGTALFAEELADVKFTPTFYPGRVNSQRQTSEESVKNTVYSSNWTYAA